MRKTVLFALVAVILVLGGATGMLYGKYKKSQADYSAMQASEETARNRYANTIDAIAEIQDSLNAIALGDANVKMNQGGGEGQISTPNGKDALDRISLLRAGIDRSKRRIQQLESHAAEQVEHCTWRLPRRHLKHGRFPSNPPVGNWTNTTRPPLTLREHHVSASWALRAPGRQFGNGANGALRGSAADAAPTISSQSAASA